MNSLKDLLSPRSSSGSLILSSLVHILIFGSVTIVLSYAPAKPPPEEYLDLGHQTFDEPPAPAEEVKQVQRSPEPDTPVDPKVTPDNTPHEMQDSQSEVAGTQTAKKESNIGNETNGTAATTPYYKIKPKYPKAALVSGVEGWVMMQIDITETGEVENIRVVDGEQRNMFQSEARRAVALWKYRPFVDGAGKPFRKADHQVRVDFKLQDVDTGG